MNITVVGLGYVGLSNAIILAQHNKVMAYDLDESRIKDINNKKSYLVDEDIKEYLEKKDLNLVAVNDNKKAYKDADYIIVATPTNYDEEKNYFDTSSVEKVIKDILSINKKCTIIIKSTVPVGYTEKIKELLQTNQIVFSPEFLREGKALYDNLFPSRIIIGEKSNRAKIFADMLVKGAKKEDIEVLYTDSTEAEAIKLFSNTYLALRISYFNELDTYAELKKLDTQQIIKGVCLDPRIGDYYNNPSFGYGGYCLPKDAKQLKANYADVPSNIIGAVVESNATRKNHIVNMLIKKNPKVVGVYKLAMKTNSDNFRQSAILDIIKGLKKSGIKTIIYEPSYNEEKLLGIEIVNDLSKFKDLSDLIICNRWDSLINDVKDKVYTRDIYTRD